MLSNRIADRVGHSRTVTAGATPRLVSLAETTTDEWARTFVACGSATFFHGPLWAEVWREYTRGRFRPAPLRASFSDGTSAIVGLTKERTRLGTERWHLSPAGTYGGWVSETPLSDRHQELLAERLRRAPSLVWSSCPSDPPLRAPGVMADTTHVIDLRDGADAARARWRSQARREVRAARKAGIAARPAETPADWLAYDALYRETLERWAAPSSVYERSLFELLRVIASPHARLWLAELDGELVAGALMFSAHVNVVGWHSASSKRGLGAARLIQWEVLGALAADGIESYDLLPSGGHAGVVAFKVSLGASPAEAPLLVKRRWRESIAARAQAALRRRGGRDA